MRSRHSSRSRKAATPISSKSSAICHAAKACAASRRLRRSRSNRLPTSRLRARAAEVRKAGEGAAGARRRRARRPAREPLDPRQCRHARSSDDDGLGAGAHPQSAARDRAPQRRFRFQSAAAAAVQCHRRAAGRRDEDAHAADRQCVAESCRAWCATCAPSSARISSLRCAAPIPSSTARCSNWSRIR